MNAFSDLPAIYWDLLELPWHEHVEPKDLHDRFLGFALRVAAMPGASCLATFLGILEDPLTR